MRPGYLGLTLYALLGFAAGFVTASFLPGGVAWLRNLGPGRATGLQEPPIVVTGIQTAGRPTTGNPSAPVTIVEFTDYQCPFCRRHAHTTLPALLAVYGSRIRYVVRNYPVASLHPDAPKAAEAAECSHAQGKFWPYHDRLFRDTALDAMSLKRYALEVGLDTTAFNGCLDSGAMAALVAQDLRDVRSYGGRGTPTFFVNGRLLAGARPFEVFAAYLDTLLAAPTTSSAGPAPLR